MLETTRLVLRRWRDEDLEPFAAMNADPQVMEFFPACLTREETKKFIQKSEDKFNKNGFGLWVAQARQNNDFLGFTGLNIPEFTASFMPCVEIGWRISAQYWGQGYATEGAKAVLEFGFKQLGLKQILSWTYEGNLRSINVMKRIGMKTRPEWFNHPALPQGHKLSKHVLYHIENPQQE